MISSAVSVWVWIASTVMTTPTKFVNALRRSRAAAISFDFAATATCPSTTPMP